MISERTFVVSIMVLILFSSACLAKKPIENKSSGTYQYQGNAQHTGQFIAEQPPTIREVLWEASLKDLAKANGFRADINGDDIVDATSPVADQNSIYFGIGGYVFGLDHDANIKWKKKIAKAGEFSFPQTPAVHKSTLIISTNNGKLFALDTQTGEKKWTIKGLSNDSAVDFVGSPLIYKGEILHTTNKLNKISIRNGEVIEQATGTDASIIASGNIVINDDKSKNILAYNFENSENIMWKIKATETSPVFSNNNIYLRGFANMDYALIAVNATNGKPKWKEQIESWDPGFISEIVTNNQGIYFYDNTNRRTYAYSHAGKRLWLSNTTAGEVAPPVIAGNRLYEASSFVSMSNTKTGKLLKKRDLPGDVWHNLFITPKGDLLLIAGAKLMLID